MHEILESVEELTEAVGTLVGEIRELKAANRRLENRLARIDRKLARNMTQANVALKVLKEGEMAETPVTELTAGKRRQVEAYVECCRENPGISMCQALKRTYRPEPNGFAFGGLKSFVWRNRSLLG